MSFVIRMRSVLHLGLFLAFCFALTASDARAKSKDGNQGSAASQCAKQADPKKKDDCVRAANEARKGGDKSKGQKQKSEKTGKKPKKDKKAKKEKAPKKDKGEKKKKKNTKKKK